MLALIAISLLLPAFGLALTPSAAAALMGVSSLGGMLNSLTLQLHGRRLSASRAPGATRAKALAPRGADAV